MPKQSLCNVINVATSLKRKRAPVWPSATRARCEEALLSLASEGLIQELSPPDEFRIHPSTVTKDKNHHERFVLVKNDKDGWTNTKIRQHAHDLVLQFGRSGFEGGTVSILNSSFTKLLRYVIRETNTNPLAKPGKNPSTSITSNIRTNHSNPDHQNGCATPHGKATNQEHHRQQSNITATSASGDNASLMPDSPSQTPGPSTVAPAPLDS